MTDSEHNASAKPQSQAPSSAAGDTPAARLARIAMSLRTRQADQLYARQLDAWEQAERDGTLDQVFGGPVSLDVVVPYLHRLGGGEIEPAIVIVGHVVRFLREEGFDDFVRVLLTEYLDGRARLSLRVSPEIHGRIATLAHSFLRLRAALPTLGERLAAKVTLHWYGTWELTLRLSGLRPVALFTPAGDQPIPDMMPLLARHIGTVVFADRALLGSPLLIGEPAYGPRDGLVALLMSLLARRGRATRAWAIAGEGLPGGALLALPQWAAEPLDLDDVDRIIALLEELTAELERRRATPSAVGPAAREELVLAIGEAADLAYDDTARFVEVLARDGPRHGIHLIAATAAPGALDTATREAFGTWLLSRLPDPEDAEFLGVPQASELSRGAILVPRLAGRQPSRHERAGRDHLRPVKIDPLELATLAQAMRLFHAFQRPRGRMRRGRFRSRSGARGRSRCATASGRSRRAGTAAPTRRRGSCWPSWRCCRPARSTGRASPRCSGRSRAGARGATTATRPGGTTASTRRWRICASSSSARLQRLLRRRSSRRAAGASGWTSGWSAPRRTASSRSTGGRRR